ncbi:hypothetical protein ABTN75_20750, partial [Acinetobacter baumannii]
EAARRGQIGVAGQRNRGVLIGISLGADRLGDALDVGFRGRRIGVGIGPGSRTRFLGATALFLGSFGLFALFATARFLKRREPGFL